MIAVGAVVGFAASIVPFAFVLVLLLTCSTAVYHGARKDGKAGRYWLTAVGEVVGMVALVAVLVAVQMSGMRH